jgi:hypothetical protein
MEKLKYRRVKNPLHNADIAEYEGQDTMMRQFRSSCEELYETIDRLEREDFYSEAVAEAAREEVGDLISESKHLIAHIVELRNRLKEDGAELVTR